MKHELASSHIIDTSSLTCEIYTEFSCYFYGKTMYVGGIGMPEIIGRTNLQVLTFASNNIIFETILN